MTKDERKEELLEKFKGLNLDQLEELNAELYEENQERFKFFDKNFKEVPAEKENNWENIAYAVDFEKGAVEIAKYPITLENGNKINGHIILTFPQIIGIRGLI